MKRPPVFDNFNWHVSVDVHQRQAIMDYIEYLEDKVQSLHDQYAHEGGKPQLMNRTIVKRWLAAIDVPSITDIYQTNAPNVFYATFAYELELEHFAQIKALGFEIIDPHGPLRNRYMLKWLTPPNDEV